MKPRSTRVEEFSPRYKTPDATPEELREAASVFREVLQARRRILGRAHPDTVFTLASLDKVGMAMEDVR